MQKLSTMTINHLISFNRADQLAQMSSQEKQSFTSEVKKQAAYYFLSASRAVEMKDYKTAKDTLIFIADSCFCIQDPDAEVRYLIEVCCQHLALIYEMENANNIKQQSQEVIEQIKSQPLNQSIYVFKYNKFSGQFECANENRNSLGQNVLFYMSKLNTILLKYQNAQKNHSVITMLQTYYPYFIMVLILIIILFAIVFSGIISSVLHLQDGSIQSQLPIILCCSLFIYPLFKIYSKPPLKKDSAFFQKKLGEEIAKINKLCIKRRQNIQFSMPEGTQIDVQVGDDSQQRR